MKVSLGICGALAALLLCGGCSTFRALFDEDPAVTQQKREKAKQRREARKRSGEEAVSYTHLTLPTILLV